MLTLLFAGYCIHIANEFHWEKLEHNSKGMNQGTDTWVEGFNLKTAEEQFCPF